MTSFGVNVPKSIMAETPEAADCAWKTLTSDSKKGGVQDVVIKAQALTGGRGRGHFKNGFQGGVHMCTRDGQAKDFAQKMLGETLVTKQTGEKGIEVAKVRRLSQRCFIWMNM